MTNEEFQKAVLGKFDVFEDKFEKIEAKLERFEAKLERIGANLERIEAKIDDVEVKNANRHLEIESKLNVVIEDNKSIHEILGEHEVSIRTLRRKPV